MDSVFATDFLRELQLYFEPAGSTRRIVLMGSMLLGVATGVLGSFALLRRQGLLGDALAHAALPGVCIAFMITGAKDPLWILLGALGTGVAGALLVLLISRRSRIKEDTSIGLVLSVFFGVGVLLLSVIQNSGSGNQSGLNAFLFGQAASMSHKDIYMMTSMCVGLLVLVGVFYKEFKVLSFDPGFGASVGLPMRRLDVMLTGLIAVSVMVGLEAVGVVLMAAMLIIPAAAARQWTDRLGWMIVISAVTGAISGAVGAVLSSVDFGPTITLPTGPVMVVAAAVVLVVSLFCAPRRGLIATWWRRARDRQRIRDENRIKALYHLGEDNRDWDAPLRNETVASAWRMTPGRAERHLRRLASAAWIEQDGAGWKLTENGLLRSQEIVRNHRLWELYLTERANIAEDHVHRDAELMEHFLSPEIVAELDEVLGYPNEDPHGREIPRGASS